MILPVDSAAHGRRESSAFSARLRRAVPSIGTALAGAALWGLAMGAGAYANLLLAAWETPAKLQFVAVLFAAGGALAFPLGLFLARFLSEGRRVEASFAAAFLCFAAATVAVTAVVYAIQYRSYYSAWHADIFSITWTFQLVFTTLAALYQFLVLGVRLFFPFGFLALFAAAFWFARRSR
ncbi:hypothetical protein [Mesorhizobium sp. WSM2239]|uniref:Transmembrane protein n=2 Tax=unclassified Mesorhizobium TaxID=325217 RepID=A0AAU8D3D4_9HYPH